MLNEYSSYNMSKKRFWAFFSPKTGSRLLIYLKYTTIPVTLLVNTPNEGETSQNRFKFRNSY